MQVVNLAILLSFIEASPGSSRHQLSGRVLGGFLPLEKYKSELSVFAFQKNTPEDTTGDLKRKDKGHHHDVFRKIDTFSTGPLSRRVSYDSTKGRTLHTHAEHQATG